MLQSPFACAATVLITRPTGVVAGMHGSGRCENFSSRARMVLSYSPQKHPITQWSLQADSESVVVRLGTDKLRELRHGIAELGAGGEGDYAIGPDEDARWDDECLWFWPFSGRTH